MLGVKDTREPIRGQFAREIRAAAWRLMTGQYNDDDRAEMARMALEAQTNDIEWGD